MLPSCEGSTVSTEVAGLPPVKVPRYWHAVGHVVSSSGSKSLVSVVAAMVESSAANTATLSSESAVLASLFCMLGAMPAQAVEAENALPGVARGERLCQAFEAYLLFVPGSQISFEHAVLLINELARGVELRLGDCMNCGGLVVIDGLALRDIRCTRCAEPS